MKAKIVLICEGEAGAPRTPKMGLLCGLVFEDEAGNKYYVPEFMDYIVRLGNRRSPTMTLGFDYACRPGLECNIDYEDIEGDPIVVAIWPLKK